MNYNNTQLTLTFANFHSRKIRPAVGSTYLERFESFHKLNPHVYTAIVALSRELKRRGKNQVGMKLLFEALRADALFRTTGSEFKLNNNMTSHYSRFIESQEPDLIGFYRKRELKAA